MPSTTTYSQARRHLKSVFDQVSRDRDAVVITRKNGGNVVVLAEEEYRSLEETAYLLRSPANARRLLDAVARDRRGEPARPLEEALSLLDFAEESADES